jgi:hypothetical protein
MSRGYPINQGGFSSINYTSPFPIVCRVDFDGTTYVADTPYADTNFLPTLAGATTAELSDVVGKKGGFTDGFGVYRKAGGGVNTSSTQAIQLAKCIETCTAYGYVEVFTGLTSSAVTLSIGTPTQTQVLLGSQPTSALTTANTLWMNTFPAAGTFPNQTSSVGAAAYYYPLPEIIVGAGNSLNMYLGTGATPIVTGSLNVFLRFGSLSNKSRNKTTENQTVQNIRVGPAIPRY